jgi:hypothetical protein
MTLTASLHGDDDLDRLGKDRSPQDDVRLELIAVHIFDAFVYPGLLHF